MRFNVELRSKIIDTNEKPYQCDCGATFSRRDLLKRHQSIGHAPNTPSSQPFSSLPAVYEPTNVQSNKDETYLGVRPPLLESTESLITQVGSSGRNGQVEEERLEGTSSPYCWVTYRKPRYQALKDYFTILNIYSQSTVQSPGPFSFPRPGHVQ